MQLQPTGFTTFQLSPEACHIKEIYNQMACKVDMINDMQRQANGQVPYVKVEVSNPDKPLTMWTGVNVIAPHRTWLQGFNNGIYTVVKNPLSKFTNVPCTNLEQTVLALKTSRLCIAEELPKVVKLWLAQERNAPEYQGLYCDLCEMWETLIKVEQVSQRIRVTYCGSEPDEKSAEAIDLEIKKLHTFQSNWLGGMVAQFKPYAPKKEEEPKEPLMKVPANLQFKDQETACRWFQKQLRMARKRSEGNSEKILTLADIKSLSKTHEENIWPEYRTFAWSVDKKFLSVHQSCDLDSYVKALVSRLEGKVSSDFYDQIGHATTMQYLLECLVTDGTKEDCKAVFSVLCNENMDGPVDLTKAPLLLSEIFRNASSFGMFDCGEKTAAF